MTDILFFLSYFFPYIALYFYRNNATPCVVQLNCTNFMVLNYFIVAHLGLLVLYLNPNGFAQLSSVDANTVLLLSIYTNIVVIMYIMTGYLIPNSTRIRLIDATIASRIKLHRGLIVVLTLIAIPFVYYKIMDGSPLLILLGGDASSAYKARVAQVATNSFFLGIKPSYFNVLFEVLTYCLILLMVSLMVKKNNFLSLLLLCVIFVVVFLNAFSNVSKGILALPLYVIYLSYTIVHARGMLFNKMLMYGLFYVLLVISVVSAWVMGNETIEYLYPFQRLIMGNLLPQYVVAHNFDVGNLLYGTTTPSWFSLGSHNQFLLDYYVWRELMGGSDELYYTAPSSFVAEAHANWSIAGVVICSFLVLLALRILDYFILTVKNPLIYGALVSYSALHFSALSIKGFTTFVVDYYFWGVLIFALFAYKMRVYRKDGIYV